MATETWIVERPRALDVDELTSLTSAVVSGSITVVGRDEPGARIEVSRVEGQPVQVTLAEGKLTVGYDYLTWDAWLKTAQRFASGDKADITIYVQRDTPVRLGGVFAEGLLAEMNADCSISTASGAITTDTCTGLLKANTVSGKLAVREQHGALKANAVSGHLTVSGELATIDVTTVSGDVAIDLKSPSSVIHVSGVSMDTTVRLPAEVGAYAKVHSVNGQLFVDGSSQGGPTFGAITVDTRKEGAGCYLDVNSINGKVFIVHADQTPALEAK